MSYASGVGPSSSASSCSRDRRAASAWPARRAGGSAPVCAMGSGRWGRIKVTASCLAGFCAKGVLCGRSPRSRKGDRQATGMQGDGRCAYGSSVAGAGRACGRLCAGAVRECGLDMTYGGYVRHVAHHDKTCSDILGDYAGSTEGETAGTLDEWDEEDGRRWRLQRYCRRCGRWRPASVAQQACAAPAPPVMDMSNCRQIWHADLSNFCRLQPSILPNF